MCPASIDHHDAAAAVVEVLRILNGGMDATHLHVHSHGTPDMEREFKSFAKLATEVRHTVVSQI